MIDDKQLLKAARGVRAFAYAPYSRFTVGAAVLTDDGRLFSGCNVENASYGLTICAERNAVCAAVAAGAGKITRLALVLSGGGTPCGACRQVLAEFSDDLWVLLADADSDRVRETSLNQLFPEAFRPDHGGSD